ncbi:MAG: AtpZ/AtpI family protein [Alphaproteobacteria bacterium]
MENSTQKPDQRLDRLARELKAKRRGQTNLAPPQRRAAQLGLAMRLATELVAGFVVGAVIGWYLDKWLGTAPWFLLIFFGLGSAAGVMNVVRTARILQESAQNSVDQGDFEHSKPAQTERDGD